LVVKQTALGGENNYSNCVELKTSEEMDSKKQTEPNNRETTPRGEPRTENPNSWRCPSIMNYHPTGNFVRERKKKIRAKPMGGASPGSAK